MSEVIHIDPTKAMFDFERALRDEYGLDADACKPIAFCAFEHFIGQRHKWFMRADSIELVATFENPKYFNR